MRLAEDYADSVPSLVVRKREPMATKTKDAQLGDLVNKADRQLAQLQLQIDQAQSQIDQAQQRIAKVQAQATQRQGDLAAKRQRLDAASAAYQQRQSYAALASGTDQEREAVAHLSTLAKELSSAERDYNQSIEFNAREEAREQAQLSAAREVMAKRQSDLTELQRQSQAMTAAREQAVQERGQSLREGARSAIAEQRQRVETRRLALLEEQIALEQCYDAQSARLADYPELAAEINALRSTSDALTRVLSSEIAYIETLLRERQCLPSSLPRLPSTQWQEPWTRMLCIPESEVWVHQSLLGNSNASLLTGRLETLQRVLSEYRESKRG